MICPDSKFTASPTCYVVLARLCSAFMVMCFYFTMVSYGDLIVIQFMVITGYCFQYSGFYMLCTHNRCIETICSFFPVATDPFFLMRAGRIITSYAGPLDTQTPHYPEVNDGSTSHLPLFLSMISLRLPQRINNRYIMQVYQTGISNFYIKHQLIIVLFFSMHGFCQKLRRLPLMLASHYGMTIQPASSHLRETMFRISPMCPSEEIYHLLLVIPCYTC